MSGGEARVPDTPGLGGARDAEQEALTQALGSPGHTPEANTDFGHSAEGQELL